jgi:hypothetical protein
LSDLGGSRPAFERPWWFAARFCATTWQLFGGSRPAFVRPWWFAARFCATLVVRGPLLCDYCAATTWELSGGGSAARFCATTWWLFGGGGSLRVGVVPPG